MKEKPIIVRYSLDSDKSIKESINISQEIHENVKQKLLALKGARSYGPPIILEERYVYSYWSSPGFGASGHSRDIFYLEGGIAELDLQKDSHLISLMNETKQGIHKMINFLDLPSPFS